MGTPYMSELRVFSFNYAPKGWAPCNGQFLPINQNQALFSLLGTTYGGNGQTTFALPDLRGRVPMHMGSGHTEGEKGGEQFHTLTISELPTHLHLMSAVNALATSGATATPTTGNSLAQAYAVPQGGGSIPVNRFSTAAVSATMAAGTLQSIGGSQAHDNMQPYLALNICIALQGAFPSRT